MRRLTCGIDAGLRVGPDVVLSRALRTAGLTTRERDVLALMAEGRSNGAIASLLVVSERAVEKHVSNIFSKLGLAPSDADHRRVLASCAPWRAHSNSETTRTPTLRRFPGRDSEPGRYVRLGTGHTDRIQNRSVSVTALKHRQIAHIP